MTLKIRQERINKKWTQQNVADQLGLSKTAIHDIETGKQKPSYDVLVKLLELFEYNDPRQLFAPVDES